MRRIGIMGGTFDPIHIGHLILAERAASLFGLEKVLIMPSGNPPHKKDRQGRASDDQRYRMTAAAIADNPHFELSDYEMHENGYTYTYRTLEELTQANPDCEYYFILGADSLFYFDQWMEPARIAAHCVLVVATRDHVDDEALDRQIDFISRLFNARIEKLDTPNIDISSHVLRDWIAEGRSIRYYVPDSVAAIIEEEHIYRPVG